MDPSQRMNRNFANWPPAELHFSIDHGGVGGGGGSAVVRKGWKGKMVGMKRNAADSSGAGSGSGGGNYQPPALGELQMQNRAKARRWFPRRGGRGGGRYGYRLAAPRNTTSFLIQAKKSGGIAQMASPYPATPAILPTPRLSPSREVVGDMAHAEWGVDGYGSMKGRIRLRSSRAASASSSDDEDVDDDDESDAEERVEVERRIDHDLSRFEMVYPGTEGDEDMASDGGEDSHIAMLEEENLTLKGRLFLLETEMRELRRRLIALEQRLPPEPNERHALVNSNDDEGDLDAVRDSSMAEKEPNFPIENVIVQSGGNQIKKGHHEPSEIGAEDSGDDAKKEQNLATDISGTAVSHDADDVKREPSAELARLDDDVVELMHDGDKDQPAPMDLGQSDDPDNERECEDKDVDEAGYKCDDHNVASEEEGMASGGDIGVDVKNSSPIIDRIAH